MKWGCTHMDGTCKRPRRICARPDTDLRRRSWVTSGTCTVASSGTPPLPSATESTEHRHSDRLSHPLASGTGKQVAAKCFIQGKLYIHTLYRTVTFTTKLYMAYKQPTEAVALHQEYNIFANVNVSALSCFIRSEAFAVTECNEAV